MLCNIKMPYYSTIVNVLNSFCSRLFPTGHFLPLHCHWYVASSLLPASLPRVSLTSLLSSSIRQSSHDFLTHFCYGYIAMISTTIKSYCINSIGTNIGLLTYCGITIIPSYHPALNYNTVGSKKFTFCNRT